MFMTRLQEEKVACVVNYAHAVEMYGKVAVSSTLRRYLLGTWPVALHSRYRYN